MIAITPATDSRAGCPIEIVNDVLGCRKLIWTPLSRGQAVESLLWIVRRSTAAKRRREPFDTCVQIFADKIVLHLHCPVWKDLEAAKAAMQALADEGRAVA